MRKYDGSLASAMRVFIDEHLEWGDVRTVANDLGLTEEHVSAVKNGAQSSRKVLQALYERADRNFKTKQEIFSKSL